MALVMWLMPAVVLILFAIVVNEMLKLASQPRIGKHIHCPVCGRSMGQVNSHWSYQFPFAVWVVTSRYNLPRDTVQRYLCPEKHTQAWYIPNLGSLECDVLVTKHFRVN